MISIQQLMLRFGMSQKLFSDVSIIFLANLGNNGVAFIINLVIAKYFSHEMFGQFSIAMTIAMTVQAVIEFGMNLTMIRLYKEYENDLIRSAAVILWNIVFKLLQFIILCIVAFFLSDYVSSVLLAEYNNAKLIFYALISGGLLLLWEFFKALFQSKNRYRLIAGYTVLYSIFRITALGYIYVVGYGNDIINVFLSVYAIPMLPLLVGGFIYLFQEAKLNKEIRGILHQIEKEYISYSKWVALGGISFILMQSSIVLMVSFSSNLKNVSLVSAGLVFTAIFNLFNASATQVLLPKAVAFSNVSIIQYKRKLLNILPLILLIGFLVICIFSGLMFFVLGDSYKESLPIFWISSAGSILVSWLGFYSLVLHSLKRPDVNGIIYLISLILFVLGGYFILNYTQLSITIYISYYVFITLIAEIIKRMVIGKIMYSSASGTR